MTLPPSDGGINRLIALRDFGEGQATRKLKELVRAYETLSLDVTHDGADQGIMPSGSALWDPTQPEKLREIDSFHAYGTVTKLTTVDGRVPDAQRWLPGAVSARLNIRVRSTTARMF